MFSRMHAVIHEIRLDLRLAWLRRRERAALRRLGAAAVVSARGEDERLRRVTSDISEGLGRIDALASESRASLEADRADLTVVASWVRPVVVLRGFSSRLVLRHRRALIGRELRPHFEAAGEIVASSGDSSTARSREVSDIRARQAQGRTERARWVAPFGGTALPAWTVRAAAEALGVGRAVGAQLRSHFLPKAPALAGLAVGWWVANTYTDSHLRSALRSLGIGRGGTRVVSSSTYEAMTFWLPLLAAALCAYAGSRISAFYARRGGEGGGEA